MHLRPNHTRWKSSFALALTLMLVSTAICSAAPTPEQLLAMAFVDIPNQSWKMARYAVTFAQWDLCVKKGGCQAYDPADQGWGRDNRPVINVSWDDAQNFIDWLNLGARHHYRLPTEDEWVYAAHGGTTTDYYWDSGVGSGHANCYGCGSQWDGNQTAPVGSFPPNPYGLYDMLGNVAQWTDTCWAEDCVQRSLLGGSWSADPQDLRVNFRARLKASSRSAHNGFRLIQD